MNWPLIIGVCAGVIVAVFFPVAVVLSAGWLLDRLVEAEATDADL